MVQVSAAVELVGAEGHERPAISARRLLLAAVIVCCAVLAIIAAEEIRSARADLLQGAAELRSVGLQPDVAALPAHPARLDVLRTHVYAAAAAFSTARGDLSPWAPVIDHLGWIPRVGGELVAAAPAADTGYHATRSALALFDGLQPVIASLGRPAGADRLGALASGLARERARFTAAADEADAAVSAAAGLPARVGNRHLDALLTKMRAELPRLQSGAHLLAASPSLLGVGRPAHYLFAWENPAELRATGGFIGAVDYLTVRNGKITHRFYGHILPHEITTAELPLPEALYTPEDYWLFCDSNFSPSFPVSARFERWFYGADTGRWADGVIDFVDTGIAPILRATGPVYLPGYGRLVTAGNVETLAQEYINGRYKGPLSTGLPETIRKQFFRAVMLALVHRFQLLGVSSLARLGLTLQTLIAHRDLLLYHQDPGLEEQISRLGAAGALRPVPGDFLMVVDDNRSYNKINPYVTETGSYGAVVEPDGRIQATLRLHYVLRPSPANLEGYGPDWGRWGTKHDYQDFLRVYVPAGSRLQSLTGADLWAPLPAYGLTQFAARLLLHARHTATVTLRYSVPPSALGSLGQPAYRLTVQRQPGANLRALQVAVQGASGVRTGSGRAPVSASLSLAGDVHLAVPLAGTRIPSAALPGPQDRDPYVAYATLTARRHPL